MGEEIACMDGPAVVKDAVDVNEFVDEAAPVCEEDAVPVGEDVPVEATPVCVEDTATTMGIQQLGSPHEPYPQQPDTFPGPQSQKVPPTPAHVPQPVLSHGLEAQTGTLHAPQFV